MARGRDDELDNFKRSINLSEFAASWGYVLDRKASLASFDWKHWQDLIEIDGCFHWNTQKKALSINTLNPLIRIYP